MSPVLVPTRPVSAVSPSSSHLASDALDTLAFGPLSHSTGRASSAVLARHQVSATTATAPSPTFMTFFTPFMPLTLAASKLFTLPPNTGQSLIAALSMFGILTSIEYACLPVSLSKVSSRFTGLPMTFQSFGSLSLGFSGTGSFDAASATLPNVVRLPSGPVMTLFSALHCSTGTFHSLAAACSSIMRAEAPPCRTYSFDSRMLRLPVALHGAPHPLALKALARRRVLGGDLRPVALQLLGNELAEAGQRALAHFRARDAEDDGVVRLDDDPDAQFGRGVGARSARAQRQVHAQRKTAGGGAADHEGAAINFRDEVHDPLPSQAFAAAWIAARICWNVPQRQMLVISRSMSASVGFGLSFSRAAAAMSWPDWQ